LIIFLGEEALKGCKSLGQSSKACSERALEGEARLKLVFPSLTHESTKFINICLDRYKGKGVLRQIIAINEIINR